MIEVRETRLPGVGSKFSFETAVGDRVTAIVHIDGLREVCHRPGRGGDNYTFPLTDEESRQLGTILVGASYRPELVQDLEVALRDVVIEWIPVPASSPIVGLTVATCRIRSTTGATIIAILREGGTIAMPHPDEVIRGDDTMVVIGRPDSFGTIRRMVEAGPVPTE